MIIVNSVNSGLYRVYDEKGVLVNKKEEGLTYTWGEVFNASLTDKIKEWVKLFRYSALYIEHFNPRAPKAVRLFGSRMSEFKNFLSIRELYKKTQGLYESFLNLGKKPSNESLNAAFEASVSWTGSVLDGVSFASRFVSMTSFLFKSFAKNNEIAKCVSASIGVCKHYHAFDRASKTLDIELQVFILLRLAVDVSNLALGVFSIGFLSVGLVPSALAMTTCSASATLFRLACYFYDKMYDPCHKNSDVNWDAFRARVQWAC